MRFSLAMLLCLLTSMPATSESLDFAIYRLTGDERTLIADGARNYTVSDIDVKKWGCSNGRQAWKRAIELEEGFSIECSGDPERPGLRDSGCRSKTSIILRDSAGNGSSPTMVTSTGSCREKGTCA